MDSPFGSLRSRLASHHRARSLAAKDKDAAPVEFTLHGTKYTPQTASPSTIHLSSTQSSPSFASYSTPPPPPPPPPPHSNFATPPAAWSSRSKPFNHSTNKPQPRHLFLQSSSDYSIRNVASFSPTSPASPASPAGHRRAQPSTSTISTRSIGSLRSTRSSMTGFSRLGHHATNSISSLTTVSSTCSSSSPRRPPRPQYGLFDIDSDDGSILGPDTSFSSHTPQPDQTTTPPRTDSLAWRKKVALSTSTSLSSSSLLSAATAQASPCHTLSSPPSRIDSLAWHKKRALSKSLSLSTSSLVAPSPSLMTPSHSIHSIHSVDSHPGSNTGSPKGRHSPTLATKKMAASKRNVLLPARTLRRKFSQSVSGFISPYSSPKTSQQVMDNGQLDHELHQRHQRYKSITAKTLSPQNPNSRLADSRSSPYDAADARSMTASQMYHLEMLPTSVMAWMGADAFGMQLDEDTEDQDQDEDQNQNQGQDQVQDQDEKVFDEIDSGELPAAAAAAAAASPDQLADETASSSTPPPPPPPKNPARFGPRVRSSHLSTIAETPPLLSASVTSAHDDRRGSNASNNNHFVKPPRRRASSKSMPDSLYVVGTAYSQTSPLFRHGPIEFQHPLSPKPKQQTRINSTREEEEEEEEEEVIQEEVEEEEEEGKEEEEMEEIEKRKEKKKEKKEKKDVDDNDKVQKVDAEIKADDQLDWPKYHSSVMGDAINLEAGHTQDEVDAIADDLGNWFEEFGFHSHGSLVPLGRSAANRIPSGSESKDKKLPPTSPKSSPRTSSSTISDTDLPMPASPERSSFSEVGNWNWKPAVKGAKSSAPSRDKQATELLIPEQGAEVGLGLHTYHLPNTDDDGDSGVMTKHKAAVGHRSRMSCNLNDDLGQFLAWNSNHFAE